MPGLHAQHAQVASRPRRERRTASIFGKFYQHEPGKWYCEGCFRVRPAEDPCHTLVQGRRFAEGEREADRRAKKEPGRRASAGPCRDPAIPAGGSADRDLVTDDIDLDGDVLEEGVVALDEALGVFGGNRVVTKEEKGGEASDAPTPKLIDLADLTKEEDNDGYLDQFSPVIICEQRTARAREVLDLDRQQQSRGDQADHIAAEDHCTTDVAKVLQLLRHRDKAIVRNALQRLHVQWYHCGTKRLQSLLRAAGAPARACNLVPPQSYSHVRRVAPGHDQGRHTNSRVHSH